MADLPIASAATLTGATLAVGDLFPVSDVSASPGSRGSKVTLAELFTGRSLAAVAAFSLRDTGAAFDLSIVATGTGMSAARTLTLDCGNVAHTLALGTTAGTITFPNAAAVTVAGLQIANVFTAANTISTAGALSTPAVSVTGLPWSGGTSTTTKPLFLIESSATSTGWATAGTSLGVNGSSTLGTSARLLDLQYGGSTVFNVNGSGATTCGALTASAVVIAANLYFQWTGRSVLYSPSDGVIRMMNAAENGFGRLCFGPATSGFAAIKASTTTLQCRLADDSAYAQFDALGFSVGGSAGASGTGTVISSITVTNGIITAISVA